MGILRMVALGATGVYAYRIWKQRQQERTANLAYSSDQGASRQQRSEPQLGNTTLGLAPEPMGAGTPSSQGFSEN